MDYDYDFIVIGGGSAGYAAARTASGLGLRTAVIDGSDELGGLCILRGCMPSKALIESANRNLTIRRAREFGLETAPAVVHATEIQERKRRLIREFAEYRASQLESGPFDLVRGTARFLDPHTLEVRMRDDGLDRRLSAATILIATGSAIRRIPLPGLDDAGYLTSDDTLAMDRLPGSMVILGGGAIALEAAHHLDGLGVAVTLIQRSPALLTGSDEDVASAIRDALETRGIRVFTDTALQRVESTGSESSGGRRVVFLHEGIEKSVEADAILLAVGRIPAVNDLGLESAGVETERGFVGIDRYQATSQPHIFAAGDVCGPYEIVHLAIQQGEVAATNASILLGNAPESARRAMDYRLKLFGVFTHPQVATVGLGEAEARDIGIAFHAASYPFDDHGKSMVMGETEGFVKLLADARTGEIIGGAVVGPEAVELIHEITVAMHFHATAEDLAAIPHYHPTLSEIWTYPAEELAERVAESAS